MLKNILLWRYGRSTWQYDVLCLLVLAFVFLTPKSWFEHSKPRTLAAHPNGLASVTLFVPPDSPFDKIDLERRVHSLPGREHSRIKNLRPIADASGRVVAYEVDLE
jgi:hypothetical protein